MGTGPSGTARRQGRSLIDHLIARGLYPRAAKMSGATAQDQDLLEPGTVTAGPGLFGPGLAAGHFVAENRGDEIPAVPPAAAAARALPGGPGGQQAVRTAGTVAGTAPAERRQPDRYHPHEEADGDGDNRPGTGIVRTSGASGEYNNQ